MTQRKVILEGGLPWGFRMHGGRDLNTPLKIYRVNPGSKAAQRGVREGDIITSINGSSTKNLTNNESHELLKSTGSTLTLGLNEDTDGSPKRRQYRTIHQETHEETIKKSSLIYSLKETVETSSSNKGTNNDTKAYEKTTNQFKNIFDTKQNGTDVRIVTNIPISQRSTPSSSSTSTPSTLVPEGRNTNSDHALASRQSSYSNCSSIPDEGLDTEQIDCQKPGSEEMNNEEDRISKSKKRRQRRKNNVLNRSTSSEGKNVTVEIQESNTESTETLDSKESTLKNLEILKLKRVEHKYRVESPKEIKIEHVKSIDKKLKAKSKSLDDDEILRIQELSEASESEDARTQSNVVISEASSEENLLDDLDSDLQKRRGLDLISLELNDNNEIEAKSPISPAEEQALRSFLGGLNLVESPEESARDLYEKTAELNDPKTIKLQKRKELEQYFCPIAENPRFLDAISEEASDISDKETSNSKKEVYHIKQCTPEQDSCTNRSGIRKETQIDQPGAVLVETKLLNPELTVETVCNPQLEILVGEKAEVVYLNDSSESLTSSGDFEEAFNDFKSQNLPLSINEDLEDKSRQKDQCIIKKASDTDENETNNPLLNEIQVKSDESLTTTFSSHTSSSTKTNTNFNKSYNAAVLSQLTPPLTPEGSHSKVMENDTRITDKVTFDYTKMPNVLFSKEPEQKNSGLKKRSDENNSLKTSTEEDKLKGVSSKNGEFKTDKGNIKTENMFVRNNIVNKVISENMNQSTVNGIPGNIEIRTIKVDEVFKNDNVETKTDFEEYKTCLNKNTVSEINDKLETCLEQPIAEVKTEDKQTNIKNNISECDSKLNKVDNKYLPNGTKDCQKNNDLEKASETNKDNKEPISKEIIVGITKDNVDDVENTKTIDIANHEQYSNIKSDSKFTKQNTTSADSIKQCSEKEINDTIQTKTLESRTEDTCFREIIDEDILKHIIMTSKDSNKTDSQKLKDFNNILMLNTELKDKINRKELIGPAFRKSKSPSTSEDTNSVTVMNLDVLPGKTFVKRRIFEFSEVNNNTTQELNKECTLQHSILKDEFCSKSNKDLEEGGFVKARINHYLHKEDKNMLTEDLNEGSVLKRLISENKLDKNANEVINKVALLDNNLEPLQKETIIPIAIEKPQSNNEKSEKIIPINVEKSYNKNIGDKAKQTKINTNKNAKQEKCVPVILKENKDKEIIIPIVIEKEKKEVEENKKTETIIPNKMEDSKKSSSNNPVNEKILPITVKNNNLFELSNNKFDASVEKIIPVQVETGFDCHKSLNKETEKTISMNKEKNIIVSKKIENNKINSTTTTKKSVQKANNCLRNIVETENIKKDNIIKQTESKNQDESFNNINKVIIPVKIGTDNKLSSDTTNKKEEAPPPNSLKNIVDNNTEKNFENSTFVSHVPFKDKKKDILKKSESKNPDNIYHKLNEVIIPIKIETDNKLSLDTPNKIAEGTINNSLKNIVDNNNTEKNVENFTFAPHVHFKGREKDKQDEILKKAECENPDKSFHKSNEFIIPVKIETDNNWPLDLPNKKGETPTSLKNIESCTFVPFKNKDKDKKNEILKKSESKNTDKLKEVIIPVKIVTDTNMPLNTSGKKAETPPIPPPRRSKINATKKGYEKKTTPNEGINMSDKVQAPNIKEKDVNDTKITYTNVLSPPRPSSAGSDSSADSEESSRCTAKYNPNSSIADVTSLTKEEENCELDQVVYEPMTLRSIVLKFFLSVPFGEAILRELAEVSKSIDNYTNKIPFKGVVGTKNDNVLVKREENMPEDYYSQKDVFRNQYGDDRHKILELHEQFLLRRRLGEGENSDVRENHVMSPNRLLTIIREEPSELENPEEHFYSPQDTTDQRLKARNLGEWLTLARHKSKSTSHIDCTNIPINNLQKTFTGAPMRENVRFSNTRRRSLPQEIYEKQLIDIMEKEREIQRELEKLEDEKRKLRAEIAPSKQKEIGKQAKEFQVDDFFVSKKGDFAEIRENPEGGKQRPLSMPVFPTEFFRQQMYDEYMDKFSEREERKQQKVIKISSKHDLDQEATPKPKEIVHPIEIEQEFMDKVKQRLEKNRNVDDKQTNNMPDQAKQATDDDAAPPVIVLDGGEVKGIETLPKHLQEFVDDLTALPQEESIWSPGYYRSPQTPATKNIQRSESQNSQIQRDEPISPIWTPKSANSSPTVERKEFRNVSFQSPVLSRKNRTNSETIHTPDSTTSEPPWSRPEGSSDTNIRLSSTLDRRFPTSQSSPGFGSFGISSRLPKAQNPTITLLQKAREGQLPRGAHYIDQDRRLPNDRPPIKYPGELLFNIKNEYTSESENERPKKMADLSPRKFEGIGPVGKDGMPLVLRSEIKDKDQSKWYKRMYDTIHKQKPHRDEFVTVKYKQKRAQYPYTSGYLSEPEPGAYDSDFTDYKYQTLDRRRMPQTREYISNSSTMPRSVPDKSYSSSDIIRNTQEKYQPGRIENYTPGRSSISDKEAKQWWDEVMDIFDGHLEQQSRLPPQKPRSFINQALKESGYESDSTLVFRRKEDTANQLSPNEKKEAYKMIQKGGDVPFQGLRKPAPERPKETDLVEFFPMSPTLTKIRIHKSIIPQTECVIPRQEYFCYPATVHHNVPKTFASFKRTAPSSFLGGGRDVPTPPPIPTTPPPSPPKRKSSRNNTTLRLISTMKVKTEKSPLCRRHETCFTPGASVDKAKINYLRDKITCKLSPVPKKKGESSKFSVVKKLSTSPEMKSKITSTLTTSRDPKTSTRRVQSSTRVSSTDKAKPTSTGGLYKSGSTGSIISKRSSTESLSSSRTSTPVRTFGTEKRKFDLTLPKVSDPKSKLSKTGSEELLSPTEVKKGIKNIYSYKKSYAPLSSVKSATIPIKVGFTDKGKNILKSAIKRPTSLSPKVTRRATVQSPCPSTSSERSRIRSSTESLGSLKSAKKLDIKTTPLKQKSKVDDKKTHKSKKDQINDSLKQKTKTSVDKKCFSKATGAEIVKKLDNQDQADIATSHQPIGSNHFFRSLFLRNIKHSSSFILPKNPWLVEKTNQLNRRRSSCSEPSIGAMKIYLKHTRPVSESRFISLDIIRSRSASPKSVTFSDNIRTEGSGASKRSKSLPSKIVFSQTSRPVSPVVTKRQKSPILKPQIRDNLITIRRSPSPQTKLYFSETSRPVSPEVKRKVIPSPPASPVMPRSPSCRKIMQLKQQQTQYDHGKPHELTLYSCPELKLSSTSLDSFRSDDYQVYLKDLVFGGPRSEKFKDLNHFYSDIEKVGHLEKRFDLKPRKKSEQEIIDYDRWVEVRSREKAEHELKHLYNHLKLDEKEKGFLFLPKDIAKFRWKKELDRGLRIKEKSVDNIKEEFERLEREESELENAKRREIAYSKDTYKPLWRGNSVANLANLLTERRSQSEGRVRTARQKLLEKERMLNHGIGSRIWSSLSMEQVNNLKKQLQEIYGDDAVIPKHEDEPDFKEYVVEVPEKQRYVPRLSVRRNSESSKHDLLSEDEKKLISQTLSKEVLEKIAKKRKEDKLALPLVVGKEVLGAKATEEANVKAKKAVEPVRALVKTDALTPPKSISMSETESASTDESTKTVINNVKDVQKKVEYFEKAKELDTYVPTIYKPAEDGSSNNSEEASSPVEFKKDDKKDKGSIVHSKSCQSFKEYFGETDLVKFATLPLSATRKPNHSYTKKPLLRALDISPIRTISEANSMDSLNRSRSASPYFEEAQALAKKGEVKKLKSQFEFFEDFFGEKKLVRSRSENDLRMYGHVEDLRRKYEYPAHSGRGRSRTKRGGVVSPVWLRAEDRYMPHINIISKIASLYSFSKHRTAKEASKSMEELAEILGCPIGEVEKMKEKFDKLREQDEHISLMGHMYTSSPNLKELRDITPYLTANWIAHKYPRSEDNTRSVSSPDTSVASRDTSLVRRDRYRPKSSSPVGGKGGPHQQQSILKREGDRRPERFDTSSSRYTKEPDLPPPPPPPKSQGGVRSLDQESPRKYVENEVTIHYKTPVRTEIKEYVSEDELAHRQAEAMKKIYEEERKRKYFQVSQSLQELQDMKSRRHTDNFIPSQKSPISLNRYDDFETLHTPTKTRPKSPEPRLVARALYNFVGQTARELTFRKGELIYVRRQVDKNWYEGELNAMVGLFPVNYVEIVPYEGLKTTPRKAHEGQARAKYNFLAQTHLELSLAKGELVTITRRVDDNWFEGKIGGRKGIFPVAYVEVLIDPSDPPPPSTKPVASPASHSLLLNGSAQGKDSMGSHLYTPTIPNPKETGYHHAKPVQLTGSGTYSTLPKSSSISPIDQTLHIDTHSDPIPYRALYRYTPQNDDELELLEGDTVFVLEKCDDGWYVGSSERTGAFGTFPGNYVEKI